jgi:alpha-L-fucosidase
MLIDITSKGGNFLLNVGPMADGRFPPESVDRLAGIGAWMAVNGEAIHGTQASPFPSLPWGRSTRRQLDGRTTRLYLHVFDAPPDGTLVVPGLLNEARGAHLLARESDRLRVERRGDDLAIFLPAAPVPDPIATVVVLDIDGRPDVTVPPRIEADSPVFVDGLDVRVTSDRADVQLRYTLDGREPTATSPASSGPVRLAGSTTVKARAFRGDRPVSPVASASFSKVAPRPAVSAREVDPGVAYEVVEGRFDRVPDFDALPAVTRGTTDRLHLGMRTRDLHFAVRFSGLIRVPTTGVYRFFLRSDDGSWLKIGDTMVVDNDGLHSSRERSGFVALEAGLHPVSVAMFEADGGFELRLTWSGPGVPASDVPFSRPRSIVP